MQSGIVLTVGQEAALTLVLKLGTAQETITVVGESALVDTRSSALSAVVAEKAIEQLPLNGRNYIDLALLQPGVSNFNEKDSSSSSNKGHQAEYQRHGLPVEQLPARRRQHARLRGHGDCLGGGDHARRRDDPRVPRRDQCVSQPTTAARWAA